MKDATVAKTQASKSGSAQKKAPAAAQSDAKGARLNVDTTGMTPDQVAALAEETLPKRKARNKVSAKTAKVSENPGKDPANVKSGEDPRSNENWKVHDLKGLSQEERDRVIAGALAEATEGKPAKKAKPKTATKDEPAPAPEDKPEEKRPPGRPSGFTQEIADLICEALAEGYSLRRICADDNFPSKATVFRWLAENKDFQDQYARAREAQADCLFDDMLEIADDGRNDTYEDDEGRLRTDHDVIARSKLRVETRKWMAGKLKPKVYGDKVDLNHGVQPDNPLASLLAQINGSALPVAQDGDEE